MNKWNGRALLAVLLFVSVPNVSAAEELSLPDEVIQPTEVITLFNGRDLEGWYTWLADTGREDPRQVFTVQDGVLRISGDGYGGLTSKQEFANYHLLVEYRWGEATWLNRKQAARDAGVLLHCQGPDGNYGGTADKPGPWMNSVECQIIEGGTGDLLVLEGRTPEGKVLPATVTCLVTRDRDGEPIWSKEGKPENFTTGRVNWFGRDPDWSDVLGFRGKNDVESPGQEWTTLECICQGDTLTYKVNGVVVNQATAVSPNFGKILLQTECAEMFVRRVELRPLGKASP